MIKSFVFRLTLGVAFTMVFVTGVVLATGGWLVGRQYLRGMDRWLTIESQQIATMLNGNKLHMTPEEMSAYIEEKIADVGDHTLYFIQIGNTRGKVYHRSANLGSAYLPPPEPGGGAHWTTNLPNISNMRVTEMTSGAWLVRVGLPMDSLGTIMDSYYKVSLVLLGATILASLIIGYIFSILTLAPIHAIEESARRIRSNNLQERVYVPKNNRELASLATEFNRAFDDLETAFAQIRHFTADASHELKTPLTIIRLNAEKLRERLMASAAPDPENETHLSNLLEETDSMKRTIESLLFIARADAGALAIERAPHDMQKFLADFSQDIRLLIEDRNLHFEITRNAPGAPAFHPGGIRHLLLNLISNAIAITPAGGKITLESEPAPRGGWRLTIADEGHGLPDDMLDHIFKRFWRYQPSTISLTSKLPQSHGLGLAICKSIATLHNGAIHAENRPDRAGLRMIFEWPRRP